MRQQHGHPSLAKVVVDQAALADAVHARIQVFDAEPTEVVAADHQEVVLRVMGDPKQGLGLTHHSRVHLDHLGVQVQRLRRFGCQMQEDGSRAAGIQLEGSQMPAEDHRIVDERAKRHRAKWNDSLFNLVRFQGGREFPAGGNSQPHIDRLVIGRNPFWVEDAGVPVDHSNGGVSIAIDPGSFDTG